MIGAGLHDHYISIPMGKKKRPVVCFTQKARIAEFKTGFLYIGILQLFSTLLRVSLFGWPNLRCHVGKDTLEFKYMLHLRTERLG